MQPTDLCQIECYCSTKSLDNKVFEFAIQVGGRAANVAWIQKDIAGSAEVAKKKKKNWKQRVVNEEYHTFLVLLCCILYVVCCMLVFNGHSSKTFLKSLSIKTNPLYHYHTHTHT